MYLSGVIADNTPNEKLDAKYVVRRTTIRSGQFEVCRNGEMKPKMKSGMPTTPTPKSTMDCSKVTKWKTLLLS